MATLTSKCHNQKGYPCLYYIIKQSDLWRVGGRDSHKVVALPNKKFLYSMAKWHQFRLFLLHKTQMELNSCPVSPAIHVVIPYPFIDHPGIRGYQTG